MDNPIFGIFSVLVTAVDQQADRNKLTLHPQSHDANVTQKHVLPTTE